MHFGIEFVVVFIVCVVLAAGAALRLLAQRVGFPFTVAMMLLGLAAGLGLTLVSHDHRVGELVHVIGRGALIHPDLIIYVFLPALVFESSFGIDGHDFFKEIGGVSVLAVVSLLASTALVAVAMWAVTGGAWGWSLAAALVFGALISATDPVAVVAILRETGAPKRLGTIIEGESMLNDGTAIVVYGVVITLLTERGADFHAAAALGEFVWVVALGAAIGVVIAWLTERWLAAVFNAPLVEITLTLVAAYSAMVVAEGLLHVSGVIAIVVTGLWLGGRGRTAVSPEVEQFLHQFWEMLAHIANTIIFFLVGLVIAAQVGAAGWIDLVMVAAAYGVVMAVRFVVVFGVAPLLPLVRSPMNARLLLVASWGGLRGAVALALALAVSQNPAVDLAVREQILLTTAGVVLLTIVINGSTTGWVLRRLGFLERPAAEGHNDLLVRSAVLDRIGKRITELARSRDLGGLDWADVERDLARRHEQLSTELARSRVAVAAQAELANWHHALRVEREAYWSAFADGTLGVAPVRALDGEVRHHLDRLAAGSLAPPPPRSAGLTRGSRWPARFQFARLAMHYEIARGAALAAERTVGALEALADHDDPALATVIGTFRDYHRDGVERVEELRVNLPELTSAIEARLARRIQLNLERDEYRRLVEHGAIDERTGAELLSSVEERMKQLRAAPLTATLPETAEVCRRAPLFAALDDDTLAEIAELTLEQAVPAGTEVCAAGDRGTSVYVIVRGAAHVVRQVDGGEQLLGVLRSGDVFGEMAFLDGTPRTATVRAATTLTLGEMTAAALGSLMERNPSLRDQVWRAYAQHRFDSHVAGQPRWAGLDRERRLRWFDGGHLHLLADGAELPAAGRDRADFLFVVRGRVEVGGHAVRAPALVELGGDATVRALGAARVMVLGSPPADPAPAAALTSQVPTSPG